MLGAIAGDIIGSPYEFKRNNIKTTDFPLFSERSRFGHAYPYAGYGGKFVQWLSHRSREPYGSFGNGSAMRVSPVAWAFDATCQGSVPEAITAFLEGESYEDTVRKAVSLGGDSDTIACIAGGIAEAFYNGVTEEIMRGTFERLDDGLREVFSQWCSWMTGGSD
ncbi:MAG: ADP-ribosylglycohydrolase family protein [Synergistaceae bacterium]|nr:ADP-ribosylglycohydrolase family protein [Synergistaceae bacterium]